MPFLIILIVMAISKNKKIRTLSNNLEVANDMLRVNSKRQDFKKTESVSTVDRVFNSRTNSMKKIDDDLIRSENRKNSSIEIKPEKLRVEKIKPEKIKLERSKVAEEKYEKKMDPFLMSEIKKSRDKYEKMGTKNVQENPEIERTQGFIHEAKYNHDLTMYSELSEKYFDMAQNAMNLFQDDCDIISVNNQMENEKRYKKALESYEQTTNCIRKYAPFVSDSIFAMSEKLRADCNHQLVWFYNLKCNDYKVLGQEEKNSECRKISREIKEELLELVSSMRKYMSDMTKI